MTPADEDKPTHPSWGKNVKIEGKAAYIPFIPQWFRTLARMTGYSAISGAVITLSVIILAGAAAIFGVILSLSSRPPNAIVAVHRAGSLSAVRTAMQRVENASHTIGKHPETGTETHLWTIPDWKGEWTLQCTPWNSGSPQIHQPDLYYKDFTGRFRVEIIGNETSYKLKWHRE